MIVPCTIERGQYSLPLDEAAAAEFSELLDSGGAYRDEPDDGGRPEYYFELPGRHDGVVAVELVWLTEEGDEE